MRRIRLGMMSGGLPPVQLLLDANPGASVAYSLRKLSSAYAGSAIRVRRSSDNAEQDINFTGGVLDTSTLLTFCGAGNGFITRWYDQSGNAKDNVQSVIAGGSTKNCFVGGFRNIKF
jgi:hypothetical protein